MDSGISDMLNSVLSNPDALNKIMTLMPAVTQMMNSGGSNNSGNQNNQIPEKIVETTTINASANAPQPENNITAENLMANAEVINAFKNLITVMNAASKPPPTAAATSTATTEENKAEEISSNPNINIEKTLDTLKNFTSVTSPESDRRLTLLLALKPFLRDGRKTKIDTAVKYMNAAKIINTFGKNGFV